ncbi:MAG: ABC transporter ATP-binding protein, partial [Pseudomonadota bacterium]
MAEAARTSFCETEQAGGAASQSGGPSAPAIPAAPALTVSNVSMAYGAHPALTDVSLSIAPGTLTALIGSNGAGKSSLVKAICGRAPIRSGTIEIAGVNAGARAARKALGVAPQRAALYDQLSAFENLVCFACQAGLKRDAARARAEEVLDLIDLKSARARRVCQISGGMRQRVNIGAAVAHHPRLVILDEPAASLDPAGVARINALIERLKSEGYAILLITHDMAQAAALADMIAVLEASRLIAYDCPKALIRRFCGEALTVSARVASCDEAAFS